MSSRYGIKARKRIKEIDQKQRRWHRCPKCGHFKVKRIHTGIWKCRKCGTIFAGGAYIPATDAGMEVEKSLKLRGNAL